MSKMIFIKEIISIAKEQQALKKETEEGKLEKDLIREERSCGRTILCTRCEALIVITANNLVKVELSSIKGDTIMLKEPHLIRKVTY